MKLAELTTSTAFRLAAVFACLFAAAVLLVFAILYVQVGRELEHRLAVRLTNARAQFLRAHQRDGFNELAGLVADEAAAAGDYESVFLLNGSDGDYVAGNVQAGPSFSDTRWIDSGQLRGLTEKVPGEQRYLALWFNLSGDGAMLIGLSDAEIRSTREVLLRTFGWGLVATVLLAISSGVFLGQRAQAQIDRVAHTLTAIRRGGLTARVPVTGHGGDIDVVSRQINGTLDQLQSLFESVNQSSADIAHDLKTPIGRLRQRLEGLRASSGTVADNLPVIDTAIAEIDGIVSTFEALLNITQIEAGARKIRFKIVDLTQVVASVLEAYVAVAEDAGMELDGPTGSPTTVRVLGDQDLLSQLLVNLIENAIRHCPKGTRIEIAFAEEPQGTVLSLRDDGPGIPEGERESVFRRLYRLEKSRTTPGSGLGLALVKAIADLHDAAIRLDDNQPGLKVTVTFPRLQAS
jgi:signal transduction histidine kinase